MMLYDTHEKAGLCMFITGNPDKMPVQTPLQCCVNSSVDNRAIITHKLQYAFHRENLLNSV